MANRTKKWEKPRCEKVRLVPEEAVLWGCKQITGAIARIGLFNTCVLWGDSCVNPAS